MHYQIFVPATSGNTLAAVGLSHLAAGATRLDLRTGPAGPGALFSWPEAGGPSDYRPAGQIWRPAIALDGLSAERYYVCLPIESRPTASELARPGLLPGLSVRLASDDWIVPAVGKLSGLKTHQELWARATHWHGVLMAAGPRGVNLDDSCWRYALDVLTLNYRLTPEVEYALELLTPRTVFDVILASLSGFTAFSLAAAFERVA